jgi:Flp pilus assembly protein TadG
MTRFLRSLLADRRGSPSVDFAMTLPILVLVTVGIMQLGIAFLANAGLRNAVEAGARYATVYSSGSYPSDSAIKSKVISSAFGMDPTLLTVADPVKSTSNGESYVEVSATYPVTFNFVFFSTPAFNLSYTRRAYQL